MPSRVHTCVTVSNACVSDVPLVFNCSLYFYDKPITFQTHYQERFTNPSVKPWSLDLGIEASPFLGVDRVGFPLFSSGDKKRCRGAVWWVIARSNSSRRRSLILAAHKGHIHTEPQPIRLL